jgi:cytochrome c2
LLCAAFSFSCKHPSTEARPEQPAFKAATASAQGASIALHALPPFAPGDAGRGRQLMDQFECNRCHSGAKLAAPPLAKDCVRCHEQIATGAFKAPPEKLAKWKPHVEAYRDAPSLNGLGGRLRPAWIQHYLLAPRDLRPHLEPTMPRLALSAEQARDIATYLTSADAAATATTFTHPNTTEVSRNADNIARGRELFQKRACSGCHAFSGSGLAAPAVQGPSQQRALSLAPDLKYARLRLEPAVVKNWLLDPKGMKPDTEMPSLGLSHDEADALAAFVSYSPLVEDAESQARRLPPLDRRVTYDEVNEKVFAVTCRHCHTNPDQSDGDGGPGHSGGFGFEPRHIDFSSYQGIQSGGLGRDGKRTSLFAKTASGEPLLVAALLARGGEMHGEMSDQVRGMPLGLPPLSPEQIQLVESWVVQGRPR